MSKTRCGFVSVIGLPNAGKSTLVNAITGAKVSIVSKKVQTTRCRILGIAMRDDAQIILMDTPGIFDPQKALDRAMVGAALQTMDEADVIIHLVDAEKKRAVSLNKSLMEKLPAGMPHILVLNKTDAIAKPALLELSQELNEAHNYVATYMISALKGDGIDRLFRDLVPYMPEGAYHYDPEQITDVPLRFMASEITREKIFRQLHEELPYAVFVHTENWEEFRDGSVKIDQAVYVQKDSQKAIVLGKGGKQIKKIGQQAREELEEFLQRRVHLKIFVKVEEGWSDNPQNFPLLGLADTRVK